jgi:catechol 2,3-dioxygenase-like lactoylglutathione lyase family enzyme
MYDHIGLRVKDLGQSVRFYEAALGALGHVLASHDASSAGLGPKGAPAFWLYPAEGKKGPGAHLAFHAASHGAVDRFYEAAIGAGGKDNGKPGLRKDYSPKYYAAFVIDPDGNNVEAVCLK